MPQVNTRRMRFLTLAALCVAFVGFGAASLAEANGNVRLPRFPSLSPDGSTIVFSWRGDLWKVAIEGGLATRLTSHPGNDLQSTWSPDGKQIAFSSDRNGYLNIYLMGSDGTDIRPLTDIDRPCVVRGFGVDRAGGVGGGGGGSGGGGYLRGCARGRCLP